MKCEYYKFQKFSCDLFSKCESKITEKCEVKLLLPGDFVLGHDRMNMFICASIYTQSKRGQSKTNTVLSIIKKIYLHSKVKLI